MAHTCTSRGKGRRTQDGCIFSSQGHPGRTLPAWLVALLQRTVRMNGMVLDMPDSRRVDGQTTEQAQINLVLALCPFPFPSPFESLWCVPLPSSFGVCQASCVCDSVSVLGGVRAATRFWLPVLLIPPWAGACSRLCAPPPFVCVRAFSPLECPSRRRRPPPLCVRRPSPPAQLC